MAALVGTHGDTQPLNTNGQFKAFNSSHMHVFAVKEEAGEHGENLVDTMRTCTLPH